MQQNCPIDMSTQGSRQSRRMLLKNSMKSNNIQVIRVKKNSPGPLGNGGALLNVQQFPRDFFSPEAPHSEFIPIPQQHQPRVQSITQKSVAHFEPTKHIGPPRMLSPRRHLKSSNEKQHRKSEGAIFEEDHDLFNQTSRFHNYYGMNSKEILVPIKRDNPKKVLIRKKRFRGPLNSQRGTQNPEQILSPVMQERHAFSPSQEHDFSMMNYSSQQDSHNNRCSSSMITNESTNYKEASSFSPTPVPINQKIQQHSNFEYFGQVQIGETIQLRLPPTAENTKPSSPKHLKLKGGAKLASKPVRELKPLNIKNKEAPKWFTYDDNEVTPYFKPSRVSYEDEQTDYNRRRINSRNRVDATMPSNSTSNVINLGNQLLSNFPTEMDKIRAYLLSEERTLGGAPLPPASTDMHNSKSHHLIENSKSDMTQMQSTPLINYMNKRKANQAMGNLADKENNNINVRSSYESNQNRKILGNLGMNYLRESSPPKELLQRLHDTTNNVGCPPPGTQQQSEFTFTFSRVIRQ